MTILRQHEMNSVMSQQMAQQMLNPIPYGDSKQRDSVNPMKNAESMGGMDMQTMQLLVTAFRIANEAKPITINNISASQSEAAVKADVQVSQPVVPTRPALEILSEMFHAFFSSGFNRVCFFGSLGMGMYIYWSYLDHRWHMAEVQRRIDSNIVLRMSQWMFDAPAPVRPTANVLTSRWIPSLW